MLIYREKGFVLQVKRKKRDSQSERGAVDCHAGRENLVAQEGANMAIFGQAAVLA